MSNHLPKANNSMSAVQEKIDAIVADNPELEDALKTLYWIVCRIDEEADKKLEGKRPQWANAAVECSNEAQGELSRIHEVILRKACKMVDEET